MRGSRVKALEKPPPPVIFGPEPPPLTIKQEAEPIINPETKLPLSAEKEVSPDADPEIYKLTGLKNDHLKKILTKLGGAITNGPGQPKNKQTLTNDIIELRKDNQALFTKTLKPYPERKKKSNTKL